MLDLSKVEAGKIEFHPERLDLAKLIGEVRDVLRPLSSSKETNIEARIDEAVAEVVTDPARLKQVLYNYISNAIKFTAEGGRVDVRVGPEGRDSFRLEVEDNGIGTKPEDVERLFVEFEQLDAGMPKRYQGTGLGLALTKRIVEAQGGSVGVRSTPGVGSVFFAILPTLLGMAREDDGGKEDGAGTSTARGKPTVLVIEDAQKDRSTLTRILRAAGYNVQVAFTGAEALDRCRSAGLDAITLDILLTDMSGWDVLKTIRAEGYNRDTPVIVVTVLSDVGAGAAFPIQDFITKPSKGNELLGSLERAGVRPGGSGGRILVVDDDVATLKLVEVTLSKKGYVPICKDSAETGLEAVAADQPAAVVLDLLMPGVNGFQFLERLRRTPVGKDAKVIVWTNKVLSAENREALAASAQAVLPKSEGGTAGLLDELARQIPARGVTFRSPSPAVQSGL